MGQALRVRKKKRQTFKNRISKMRLKTLIVNRDTLGGARKVSIKHKELQDYGEEDTSVLKPWHTGGRGGVGWCPRVQICKVEWTCGVTVQ